MKRILSFVMMAALAFGTAAFTACSDDEKGNGNGNGNGNTGNSSLAGKWEVEENDLGIVSVEFDGRNNYVVVATNEWLNISMNRHRPTSRAEVEIEYIPLFGTYTVEGDKVILSGFGTITISSIADGVIEFTLEVDGEDEAVSLSGEKQQEMASSSKTDMLCRTWKLVSMNPPVVEEGEDGDSKPEFVYFSKAGTYLVSFENGESMLSNWKWKSEADGTIYYSDEFPPVWEDEYTATVTKLTANLLEVTEVYEDGGRNVSTWEPVK